MHLSPLIAQEIVDDRLRTAARKRNAKRTTRPVRAIRFGAPDHGPRR